MRILINILIIIASIAFTFSTASAAEISDDLSVLMSKAKSGDNVAAFKYAERLQRGLLDRKPDKKKAAYWLKISAQQGNADAAIALATMYERGEVIAPTPTSAKEMYEYAYRILRVDADKGLSDAATKLGLMFAFGHGVEKDPDKAIKWLQRGVDLGSPQAMLSLAKITIWNSTPGYNTAQALEMLHDAAEMGLGSAWLQIGIYYSGAFGGRVNHPRAVDAFRKAHESGSTAGTRQLGISYLTGFGIKRNFKRGAQLIMQAAQKGSGDAIYNLAQLYRHGVGVPKNKASELKWLKLASAYDTPDADYYLGLAYRDGDGVKQDNKLALKYFKKAGAREHVLAIRDYKALIEKISPSATQHNSHKTKIKKPSLAGDEVEME